LSVYPSCPQMNWIYKSVLTQAARPWVDWRFNPPQLSSRSTHRSAGPPVRILPVAGSRRLDIARHRFDSHPQTTTKQATASVKCVIKECKCILTDFPKAVRMKKIRHDKLYKLLFHRTFKRHVIKTTRAAQASHVIVT